MKERPILFSAPMVRALLDGSKTQTRRVMKPQPRSLDDSFGPAPNVGRSNGKAAVQCNGLARIITCPYGQPGDRLWVRETFSEGVHQMCDADHWVYAADPFGEQQRLGDKWKPSIFMPRSASRITLEITDVRVERLLKISEADAKAEGAQLSEGPCTEPEFQSYTLGYLNLWNSINGPGSWDLNPWVWVIEFKVVTP